MGAASVLIGLTFMGSNSRPVKASKTKKINLKLFWLKAKALRVKQLSRISLINILPTQKRLTVKQVLKVRRRLIIQMIKELKMYDKNGNLMNLKDNTVYVTVGSLNNGSTSSGHPEYIEKAEIISSDGHIGEGVALPESDTLTGMILKTEAKKSLVQVCSKFQETALRFASAMNWAQLGQHFQQLFLS